MMAINLASENKVMWGMSNSQFNFSDKGFGTEVFTVTPASVGLGSLGSLGNHNNISDASIAFGTVTDGRGAERYLKPDKTATPGRTTEAYSANGIAAKLPQFSTGTILPCGMFNTINIIEHRNEMVIKQGLGNGTIPGANSAKEYIYDEKQNLDELLTNTSVQNEASLYPAASYCYCYTPTVKEGDVLNAKFTRHNWYLPSMSELLHMWICSGTNTTYCLNKCKQLKDAGIWVEPMAWDSSSGPTYWSSNQRNVNEAQLAIFRTTDMRTPNYDVTTGGSPNGITRHYVRACARF